MKEFFTFTKGQHRALIVLLIFIFLASIFYFSIPSLFSKKQMLPKGELEKWMAQIEVDTNFHEYSSHAQGEVLPSKLNPFPFDPNTLDEKGFKKLGLRDKLIATILNYRNKGGKFYNNESLRRIYGLQAEEYKQLEPFIDIENRKEYAKLKPAIHVELNIADTALLVQLRMIGSKLAMRIVEYRERLGGFVHVNQLKEVYGISPETFAIIAPNCSVHIQRIKKINLQTATYSELNAHPYLHGELATAIADFRKSKHYQIDNLKELKEIPLINEEIFRKIVPYLSLQ
jgi:DNA uptake protein ComE-like DNA-binding protein